MGVHCSTRCVVVAHVAVPMNHSPVETARLKGQGTALWKLHGPWAQRKLASMRYQETSGSVGVGWDSGGENLLMETPPVLYPRRKNTFLITTWERYVEKRCP